MGSQRIKGFCQNREIERGWGVQLILERSERLSGKLPVYRLLDEVELMLTIFAAVASD